MDLIDASGEAERVGSAWAGIPGEIRMGGWTSEYVTAHLLDRGWLPCNGQEVSKATYDKLFEAIGLSYGTPVDASNFLLPNSNDAVPGGIGSVFLLQSASYGTNTTQNITLAHTHAAPVHAHTIASHTHAIDHDHDIPAHTHLINKSDFSHSHDGDTGLNQSSGHSVTDDGTSQANVADDSDHSHVITSSLTSGTSESQGALPDSPTGAAEVIGAATSRGASDANTVALTTATDGATTTDSKLTNADVSPIQKTFVVRYIIKT